MDNGNVLSGRNWSRIWVWLVLAMLVGGRIYAQDSAPVRVAMVAEGAAAVRVLDLLTVELGEVDSIALLEREQVERVYREQELAGRGSDWVRLGELLGAEGLLMLTPLGEGTNRTMQIRLVAVRPGVVVSTMRTRWPGSDLDEWVSATSRSLASDWVKLGVKPGEAVPISVVNLRSAGRSAEARDAERLITLLTTERLSRERSVFVLERRRMDLLAGEKELKDMGDSKFWSGSHLLEGTIDRDGYAPETVTIDARLSPPGGGAAVEIAVKGPRAALAKVVEELADRILAAVNRPGQTSQWQPEAEAERYFEEARWALKWGMVPEARSAAEAAWALGKQDLNAAMMRVDAYTADLTPPGELLRPSYSSVPSGSIQSAIRDLRAREGVGELIRILGTGRRRSVEMVKLHAEPSVARLDQAITALRMYVSHSAGLPEEEPVMDSPWYHSGVTALNRVSRLLQLHYIARPKESEALAKLVELRGLSREVAARIVASPTVRGSYWLEGGYASSDSLDYAVIQRPSIYLTQILWGPLWQEKPEDCIALYRELLKSPVIHYFHKPLWLPEIGHPRVVAWNEPDRDRVDSVWRSFLTDLEASSDFLLRMEGKALKIAEEKDPDVVEEGIIDLLTLFRSNAAAVQQSPVDLTHGDWGLSNLLRLRALPSERQQELRNSDGWKAIAEIGRGKASGVSPVGEGGKAGAAPGGRWFILHKKFLSESVAADPRQVTRNLALPGRLGLPPGPPIYTRAEAEELKPLLDGYMQKVRELRKPGAAEPRELAIARREANAALSGIRMRLAHAAGSFAESSVVPPTSPPSGSGSAVSAPRRVPGASRSGGSEPEAAPRSVGRRNLSPPPPASAGLEILTVRQFVPIPLDQLTDRRTNESFGSWNLNAFRVDGDRHWFDLQRSYMGRAQNPLTQVSPRDRNWACGGFWDPKSGRWEKFAYPTIEFPPDAVSFTSGEVVQDGIYVSGWESLARRDARTGRWATLPAPWQEAAKLFVVHGRLFAAGADAIHEIRDQGRKIDVLVNCRRRPAVTDLDRLETLGKKPTVFAGPKGGIRVHAGDGIHAWDGRVWTTIVERGIEEVQVDAAGAVLLGQADQGIKLVWMLGTDSTEPRLAVAWNPNRPEAMIQRPGENLPADDSAKRNRAVWGASFSQETFWPAMAMDGEDLYVFSEHNERKHEMTRYGTRILPNERDGRHGHLTFLRRSDASEVTVPLKFDVGRGMAPGGQLGLRSRLLVTKEHLVLTQATLDGVWFIPRSELNPFLEKTRREVAGRLRSNESK